MHVCARPQLQNLRPLAPVDAVDDIAAADVAAAADDDVAAVAGGPGAVIS